MTPASQTKHHKIAIDYNANPPGQAGARPLRVAKGATFEFINKNPGTLTLEFIGDSPLAGGVKTVTPGQVVKVVKPGSYKFKCRLVRPDGQVVELDPAEAASAGGEIEVPPEG